MTFKWCLYLSESALLWVFWLSVGADAAAVKAGLIPTGLEFIRRSTIADPGVSFCHFKWMKNTESGLLGISDHFSADRNKFGAIAAFGFMIWLIRMFAIAHCCII